MPKNVSRSTDSFIVFFTIWNSVQSKSNSLQKTTFNLEILSTFSTQNFVHKHQTKLKIIHTHILLSTWFIIMFLIFYINPKYNQNVSFVFTQMFFIFLVLISYTNYNFNLMLFLLLYKSM